MPLRFTLPMRLALLVAGTTLPLILFAGALVYSNYVQDQRDAFENVRQVSRGIRLVLDRELQGMVSGLTVLANSRALAADDFESFRVSADAFIGQYPGSSGILIGDRAGHTIFVSSLPQSAALPVRTTRSDRDEVYRTGKPAFSRVFSGTVSKRPVVVVSVPVMRGGEVIYDMAFSPPLEVFQRILDQQRPGEEWTMSIFDQAGYNIARLPNPETNIGQRASALLLERLFVAAEARFPTVSREGTRLLTAVSRSEISGWVAVSGVAENTLTAPLLKSLLLTASIGGIMLLIGLGFALRMATQLVRAETLHGLLINELNHRVKNTLATVQSLAGQTFRSAPDREARIKFDARLVALGRAHDLLSEEKWVGANIVEVMSAVLAPFEGAARRISAAGPALRLSARSVMMLSMVIHELATNASKYGALSTPGGRVQIAWGEIGDPMERHLRLTWQEIGGPCVGKPARAGFGSTLIEQGVKGQLDGNAALRFEPDGVTCEIECPLR